ncbi:MAG: hypothetical protein WCK95_29040 [Alphaproteobacteria bacterium]
MPDTPMTVLEFAARVAIDGGFQQERPAADREATLRRLGMIGSSRLSGLPARTAKSGARVKAGP